MGEYGEAILLCVQCFQGLEALKDLKVPVAGGEPGVTGSGGGMTSRYLWRVGNRERWVQGGVISSCYFRHVQNGWNLSHCNGDSFFAVKQSVDCQGATC